MKVNVYHTILGSYVITSKSHNLDTIEKKSVAVILDTGNSIHVYDGRFRGEPPVFVADIVWVSYVSVTPSRND